MTEENILYEEVKAAIENIMINEPMFEVTVTFLMQDFSIDLKLAKHFATELFWDGYYVSRKL